MKRILLIFSLNIFQTIIQIDTNTILYYLFLKATTNEARRKIKNKKIS